MTIEVDYNNHSGNHSGNQFHTEIICRHKDNNAGLDGIRSPLQCPSNLLYRLWKMNIGTVKLHKHLSLWYRYTPAGGGLNQPEAYLIITTPDNSTVNECLYKNDISKLLFYKLKMVDMIIHESFLEQTSSMAIQNTGYADRVAWVIKWLTDHKGYNWYNCILLYPKDTIDNIILNTNGRN